MDIWGGSIILKIVFLQVLIAIVVLILLSRRLEHEFLDAAIEQIMGLPHENAVGVDEVVIVSARVIQAEEASRLNAAIMEKFSRSRVVMSRDASLGAGVVIRIGEHVLDHSLWTRVGQMVRGERV